MCIHTVSKNEAITKSACLSFQMPKLTSNIAWLSVSPACHLSWCFAPLNQAMLHLRGGCCSEGGGNKTGWAQDRLCLSTEEESTQLAPRELGSQDWRAWASASFLPSSSGLCLVSLKQCVYLGRFSNSDGALGCAGAALASWCPGTFVLVALEAARGGTITAGVGWARDSAGDLFFCFLSLSFPFSC